MLKTHKELEVWQKSFELCKTVYRVSARFPSDERFGLTAQVRRSAVSVPSNISEGYNRGATRDYVRFLWIANGSLAELETQVLLAGELGYVQAGDSRQLSDDLGQIERMLRAMIRSLEVKMQSGTLSKHPRPSPRVPRSPGPLVPQSPGPPVPQSPGPPVPQSP